MSTAPSLPLGRRQCLKLVYKIPTDKFVCSSYPTYGSARWIYTTEIAVEKQWDYPNIPQAIWTVKLLTESADGAVTASITPNNPAAAAAPINGVWVDIKIGATACGPFDVLVGVDGWTSPKNVPLASLTEPYRDPTNGQQRFQLRKGVYAYVTLTFYAQKLSPRADLRNTLTDCTLICEEQEFPAHRAVLAANSPVFAAMFQDEMKEKLSGVCKIDDVGRAVLEEMLKFMYTGTPFGESDTLDELWIAADKYDIKDLCSECERIMMQTVTPENAVKYFYFARERSLKELKMIALKVIAANSLEID